MNLYKLDHQIIDSVELKCLVVSKGVKIESEVYRKYAKVMRFGKNPMMCNCAFLSDNTLLQITDMSFHFEYLFGMLTWNNLKLMKYANQMKTFFSIRLFKNRASLYYKNQFLDWITFPEQNHFYSQKTSSGIPYIGNAVLQGIDWVSFQCLWPCEFACAGKPCQFCFSGDEQFHLAQKNKKQVLPLKPNDFVQIVEYAMTKGDCRHVQITGGSTFNGETEYQYLTAYLRAIQDKNLVKGEILLYISPPKNFEMIDEYFALGADRIACSLEVWDENLAEKITPGKIEFSTRKRHLEALEYIVSKYGRGKAFSNFIIGLEPYESLKEGATYLARRGIIPTASIWMPMGKPVENSLMTPTVDYYRKVKNLFGQLYQEYDLKPTDCCGLNVCMEEDIYLFSAGFKAKKRSSPYLNRQFEFKVNQ